MEREKGRDNAVMEGRERQDRAGGERNTEEEG